MSLQVPFGVATEADQALYIDADAIVLCDLERLWDTFDAPASSSAWGPDPRALIAAAQDGPHAMYPTPYSGDVTRGGAGRKPTGPMYPRGINAGEAAGLPTVLVGGRSESAGAATFGPLRPPPTQAFS
jgi:hypothetical protein